MATFDFSKIKSFDKPRHQDRPTTNQWDNYPPNPKGPSVPRDFTSLITDYDDPFCPSSSLIHPKIECFRVLICVRGSPETAKRIDPGL